MGFKNYSNSNEPTYKVLKVFGQLDSDSSKPKELRLIQWGKNAPKYDLRGWGTDENGNVIMTKGITLDSEELQSLYELLQRMNDGYEGEDVEE